MPSKQPAPTNERRIIVLDDDVELLGMIRRYLGDNGFNVHAVAHADQLDRYLQREPYDALVLDLMMPGEDGLAICRRLGAPAPALEKTTASTYFGRSFAPMRVDRR